jgi:hypothetical protein
MEKLKYYKYKQQAHNKLVNFTMKYLNELGIWRNVQPECLSFCYKNFGPTISSLSIQFNGLTIGRYSMTPFSKPFVTFFIDHENNITGAISLSNKDCDFNNKCIYDLVKTDKIDNRYKKRIQLLSGNTGIYYSYSVHNNPDCFFIWGEPKK